MVFRRADTVRSVRTAFFVGRTRKERGHLKRFFRRLCALLTPLCLAAQAGIGFYATALPSAYVVAQGDPLLLPAPVQVNGARPTADESEYDTTLTLLGVFPVKEVSVHEAGDMDVLLGGQVFGMKLYTSGVLVVGLTDVDTVEGSCHPAADAGVQKGDVIERINGQPVSTKGEVAALVEQSGGQPMTMQVRRDGLCFPVRFAAVPSLSEGRYKAGLWVRDSSAGIGTMTFYVPSAGVFAGLGHPICDVDTGDVLPISGGEAVPARIYSVTRGVGGDAGELCGGFDGDGFGQLCLNGRSGVYGRSDTLPSDGEWVAIAPRQEVSTGAARLRCTLDDSGPAWYDVEIRRVRYSGGAADMDIEVTDPVLLERTGGIVQGMSGSPLVQNGKLIGAVTHVLVDDPRSGYAIFAEDMLKTAQELAAQPSEAAA